MQNIIKKGTKVQIEFDTIGSISSKQRIDCYVISTEYDRLTISFPVEFDEYAPYLTEGVEIRAFIYTFTGIVILNSIILDSPYDGQIVIEYNEEHQVIQRRKYLRVPYSTDLYLIFPEENYKANTIDIGGGGVRFLCNKDLGQVQEICAQLRLAKFDALIKIDGIILKKNFYKKDEYVFEFTKIEERKRDLIIQKCIELEREQNNKY